MKLSFERLANWLGIDGKRVLNQLIDDVENNFKETTSNTYKAQTDASTAVGKAEEAKIQSENVQEQVNTLVVRSGESSAQVLQALTNANGETFDTLKAVLDNKDSKIASLSETTTVQSEVLGKSIKEYLSLIPNKNVAATVADWDWTQAIQALINSGRLQKLPPGRYRVTDELVMDKNRITLEGAGFSWSGDSSKDTVIFYDGPTDPNKAVLRVSKSAIGVDPTTTLSNVQARNLVLDGNGKAGYGLYTAYVSDDSMFENITAVNTTEHGIRIEKQWYVAYRNLIAKNNFGCGITIGRSFSGWGTLSEQVNSVYLANLRAHSNGRALTSFNETTDLEKGYGIGLYNGYNLKIRGLTSEKNGGAGLVFKSKYPNVGVDGIYMEQNCPYGSKPWGIIYIGQANGRNHALRDVYIWGEQTHYTAWQSDPAKNLHPQSIWLTGTKPTLEIALELKNVAHGKLKADWSNYQLRDVYFGMADYIEGHLPLSENTSDYSLSTLYVRSDGSDSNNGRTTSTAFATLEQALKMASYAKKVTTIDCTGVNLQTPTLDFSSIRKEITINGGGTAVLANTSNNTGVTINHARYGVVFKDFSKISRIIPSRSNVRVETSTLALTDTGANGLVYGNDSDIRLVSCQLSNGTASHSLMTGLTLANCKLTMESTTLTGFTVGRNVQLRDGSFILSDSWLTAFDSVTIDDAGYIMGGSKMKNKAGVVNFV